MIFLFWLALVAGVLSWFSGQVDQFLWCLGLVALLGVLMLL
jgi:hypothetical protein